MTKDLFQKGQTTGAKAAGVTARVTEERCWKRHFYLHSVEKQRSKNMDDMGPFVFRTYSVLGIHFCSCLS